MARADGREGGREVAVDAVAQADDDPGGEARPRAPGSPRRGHRPPRAGRRSSARAGDLVGADGARAREHSVPATPIRARYSPYGPSGGGAMRPVDPDDGRRARSRGTAAASRRRGRAGIAPRRHLAASLDEPQGRDLLALAATREIATTSRSTGREPSGRAPPSRTGPAGDAMRSAITSAPMAPRTSGREPTRPAGRRRAAGDPPPPRPRRPAPRAGRRNGRSELRSDEARGDRADRQPAARGHRRRRRVSPDDDEVLILSNVAAPTSFRVRRSSTAAKRCSSRAARIFAAVTGPMPGSPSSSRRGRRVQVDRAGAGAVARRSAGAPRPLRAGGRIVARRDDDLVAVVDAAPRG